jgi:adenosylhomocysteine nucleosidase
MTVNNGMIATGGSTISNSTNHAGNIGWPRPDPAAQRSPRRADVGVLTVLDQEIRAVLAVLRHLEDYREQRLRHGPLAREAWLPAAGGGRVRLAALQTLTRGTESAALAYRGLVEAYNPSIVLLVGIAGGVSPRVGIGDVVISDEVIAYDARRVTAEGVHRRGQAQAVAGPLGHRLNDFFANALAGQSRPAGEGFHIHRGPIGSGNAVVTDAGSDIRRWLLAFHEKVLAVETEAAGVAQSFHESVDRDGPRGWLTIRGISDAADRHKDHDYHDLAAKHAAEVMAMLAPYLRFDES